MTDIAHTGGDRFGRYGWQSDGLRRDGSACIEEGCREDVWRPVGFGDFWIWMEQISFTYQR